MVVKHFFVASLLCLAACPDPIAPPPEVPPDAAPELQRTDVLLVKAKQNPDLDLLLVIDDSPSMLDKQNALTRALPALQAQLAAIPGGVPNLHIGVVTSDMGTSSSGGAPPAPPIGSGIGSCSGTGKDGLLQTNGAAIEGAYVSTNRDGAQNFVGAFTDPLATMIGVGAAGCGFEQPLAAMRAALSNTTANAGFLRESANLAVVVLSDEDDCSVHDPRLFSSDTSLGPLQSFRCFQYGVECTPDDPLTVGTKSGCAPRPASLVDEVAPFEDFLLQLKGGDARKLMFGAIVGDPSHVAVELRTPPGGGTGIAALEHSCSFTTSAGTAVADPGVRFQSLVDAFPGRSVVSSVCSDDLAPSVTAIGASIRRLVGDTCLEKPIAQPADCIVEDVSDSAATAPVRIPSCGAGVTGDCYMLVSDSTCSDAAPLRLAVTRTQPAAEATWTRVRCVAP
jgi:hypothetical protein